MLHLAQVERRLDTSLSISILWPGGWQFGNTTVRSLRMHLKTMPRPKARTQRENVMPSWYPSNPCRHYAVPIKLLFGHTLIYPIGSRDDALMQLFQTSTRARERVLGISLQAQSGRRPFEHNFVVNSWCFILPHAGILRNLCPGPGSVNARRAKRGLAGCGLVRDAGSIWHEGRPTLMDLHEMDRGPFRNLRLLSLSSPRTRLTHRPLAPLHSTSLG
jgi:hypothetical protein